MPNTQVPRLQSSWRAALDGADPARLLLLFLGAQLVIWTVVPKLFAISLPLDVVSDGLGWGHEWQWGYYKHPPLPSWTVEAFFDAFGDWGPFLLSQVCVCATLALVYRLGCCILAAREALAGTLLLAGVYYFSIPTPEFNHNVAQMPLWAGMSYAYYRALISGKWWWWIALGALAGLAMLTKYASAVLLLAILAHLLSTRKTARLLTTPGPWLAVEVMVVVMAPHLVWLVTNHFPTLHYAEARAGHAAGVVNHIVAPFRFLLSQAAALLPCFLVAYIAGLFTRPFALPGFENFNWRFLFFLGVGPALITALISLLSGFGIRDMWGAPMWNLTGLLIVYAARPAATLKLERFAVAAAALLVILPFAYVISTSLWPEWKNKASRTQWPDRAMAETFETEWAAREHSPLAIVASDGWLGGLIAMRLHPRASVYIDADPRHAPWITPAKLAKDGALVVWRVTGSDTDPPPGLRMPGLDVIGVVSFPWPDEKRAAPLNIGWGIVAPAGGAP